MASRPSKFDFWTEFQSQPGQSNMASRLQILIFGGRFKQSLDNVTWPAGLQSVTFDTCSAEKLNVVWPEGLQSLSFLRIELAEESSPDSEYSEDSDSRVDLEVVLRGTVAQGTYVNWCLASLLWCVEKIVCWRCKIKSYPETSGKQWSWWGPL